MGRWGSLDYKLTAGTNQPLGEEVPYMETIERGSPTNTLELRPGLIVAGQVSWETPVDGLRLVVSYTDYRDAETDSEVQSSAEVQMKPRGVRNLPGMVNQFVFPGAWDALLTGKSVPGTFDMTQAVGSVEFLRGNWTLAWEYMLVNSEVSSDGSALGPQMGPLFTRADENASDAWYASAAYRVSSWLEVGTYYGESVGDTRDRDGSEKEAATVGFGKLFVPAHTAYQKDWALAASFNLTRNWLLKGEFHLLEGTGYLHNRGGVNGDVATWESGWNYFILKTSYNF